MTTMRLLVGGQAALSLFSFNPEGPQGQVLRSDVSYSHKKMPTAWVDSNPTIFPCREADGSGIGPIFTVEDVVTTAAAAEGGKPGVTALWVSIAPPGPKIVYQSEVGLVKPSHVLALSQGRIVAAADAGNGTVSILSVDANGGIPDMKQQYKIPPIATKGSMPTFLLEREEKLYVLDAGHQRVYVLDIDETAAAAVGTTNILTPSSVDYYEVDGKVPRRATFDHSNGWLYVLTETAEVYVIDTKTSNRKATFVQSLVSKGLQEKIDGGADNVVKGGDIVWTTNGLVASTRGVKTMDPTRTGDFIWRFAQPNPAAATYEPVLHTTALEDINILSLSPDGKYLFAAGETNSRLKALKIEPGKNLTSVVEQPFSDFKPRSIGWLADCTNAAAPAPSPATAAPAPGAAVAAAPEGVALRRKRRHETVEYGLDGLD